MDRDGAVERDRGEGEYGQADPAEGFALPSRASALDRCRSALAAGVGPVLLTGEPGAGKTWLWRRWAAELAGQRLVVGVDPSPSTDPAALDRTIGHHLGIASTESASDPRLALADHLRERADDGRRWVLVLDEAHNLSDATLEEVRILSNRLGRPDGFDGLLLVGQTRLARRLARQSLAGLEARLATRIHLLPIDAEEAGELLARRWPRRAWDLDEVERLHRDASGNPRRLLRLAMDHRPVAAPSPAPRPAIVADDRPERPAPAPALESDLPEASPIPLDEAEVASPPPLLGPVKPPIRVEEGLIEVGWEPAPADASASASSADPRPRPRPLRDEPSELSEEALSDHYAALQAWNEWAQNQGRLAGSANEASGLATADSTEAEDEDEDREPRDDRSTTGANRPNVWAEGPDSFAPYGQLFSRLRQPKDPD